MANKQFNSVDGYSVGNANVVIDSNGNISGNVITATANITAPQIISNVATGTAPLVVSSTTQVANLNAATAGTATSATNAAALLQNTSTATTVYPMFTASSANGNSSAVFNTSIVANLSNASISATTFVGRLVGNVANGTSTISIPATNGNINLSSAGNANILVVTGTGANITGTANVTGNLAAGNISANIANFTTANITGNLAAGNITTGTGTGGNISGANVISANLFTGTLTTSAQPNITSVGTLTGLTVNGNITLNNTASVLNANSASDALRINQIGTGNALVVEDAANPDSTPFVISGDGNVSIGGTTPTNKLQVVIPDSAALGQGIELNTVGNTGYFRITGGWSGGFLPAFAGKASNNSGSFGYGMLFNGLSGNASDTANGVITFSARDNAGTANVGSTQTAFAFRNYVSNLMVIMGSGNVGMGGNIAPAHTVSINGTLNASGNANVGNIGATNGVFTNVSGNGSALSSITGGNVTGAVAFATTANSVAGANVSGQVANSLVAGTVYTNAQPNITSVGTLTTLAVTGNISGNNLSTTNTITAGNGLQVSSGTLTVTNGNLDVTGNINVTGNLNYSNVTDLVVGDPLIYIGANNTGDTVDLGMVASYNNGTYQHTGIARNSVTDYWTFFDGVVAEPTTVIDWANATYPTVKMGNLITTANANIGGIANITGNAIVGGTLSVSSNANVGNIGATNAVFTNISGNGSGLTAITGANVTGTVANATYAVSAGSATSATSATTAGTVTTNAQPNITSVGTLTSLAVTGNVTVGNVVGTLANGNSNISIPVSAGNITIATNGTERIRVTDAGKVGVNTATPYSPFTVRGESTQILLDINSATDNTYSSIAWNGSNVDVTVQPTAEIRGYRTASGALGALAFHTRGSLTTSLERMRIDSAGNVGIANTAPTHTLSVTGTMNVSGNANVGNIGAATGVFTGNANASAFRVTNGAANAVTSVLAYGADNLFQFTTQNGSATNATGNEVSRAGINYSGVGWDSFTQYVRGGSSQSGWQVLWAGNTAIANISNTGVAITGALSVSGTSNLGPVSNVTIAGGSNGQVLTTNGSGVLSWSTPSGGVASISNGTSNVNIATSGGNITMGVGGVDNVVTVTSSNVQLGTGSGGNISGVNVVTANTFISSVATGVSAAGTTQGTATGLTAQISVVSTVASGAGVRLPTATPGMRFTIMNTSANALLVYPATNGIINSQAANAAYSQPAGARLDYISTTTTQWYTLNATYG